MPKIRPVPISKLRESPVDLKQDLEVVPNPNADDQRLRNQNLKMRFHHISMRCDVCQMEFETSEKFNQHFQTKGHSNNAGLKLLGHRALTAVKRSNRSNYIYHRPKKRQFNGGAVQDNVAEKSSKSTNDFNNDLYCIDDDMEICQSGNS